MTLDWLSMSIGFIVGILALGIALWKLAPGMMLLTHESKLPFDETVATLVAHTEAADWQVPKIYDLQKSLGKDGYKISPLKVVSICNPHHAAQVLEDDHDKAISAMMPCRLGVYQTRDGKVYIAAMNTGLMSKMFGPKIAKVMAAVVADEAAILKEIIR
jgi:uncharacterized protein (DUF302 family)